MYNVDRKSSSLGMIEAFCEVVGAEVKTIGLSPSLTDEELNAIMDNVKEIVLEYKVKYYVENDFPVTYLAAESYTKDKNVIFFYKDDKALEDYLKLKADVKVWDGTVGEMNKLTYRFCKLLSYSDNAIKEKFQR